MGEAAGQARAAGGGTKVPAVFDTAAGTPAVRIAAAMAFTGSVEKYAADPPGTTGSSAG